MMSWSSIQRFGVPTMTLTHPPQRPQISIWPRAPSLDAAHQFTLSILKTRLSLWAHVIAAWRSAGELSSLLSIVFVPLPR